MPDRGTILAVDDDHLTCELLQGALAVNGQVVWADPRGTQISHGIAFREPRGHDFALALFLSENV